MSVEGYIAKSNGLVRYCPITPGCTFYFEYDGSQTEFNCPRCNKSYCIECKIPFHKGMLCVDYKAEQERIEREKIEAAERLRVAAERAIREA